MSASHRIRIILTVLAVSTLVGVVGAQSLDPREDFATAADFGRRFFEAGKFAASLTWFEKADSIVRDQPAILYNTAIVLVKLQRYDEAQTRIDRYIALSQGREVQAAKALQLEVKFLIEFRRGEVADKEYKTLFSRARALHEKSLQREALEAFRQAEQIHPDDPVLYYNEGVLYEEDEAFEDALRSYNRYLQSNPANGSPLQAHLVDLKREIDDIRTKLICPICGAKLPAGARWCHHCWHGPYDVTNAAWNARACDLRAVVTRTVQDANGKTRISEPLACLFGSRSLHDFLQYSPATQTAVRDARTAEGWSFTADGLLQSRRGASGVEVMMQHGECLQGVVNLPLGEAFAYKGHKTGDGIWLLDAQPYSTGDQLFFITRSFDTDGRVLREEVRYDSVAWRHAVSYVATYTYEGESLVSAQIKGGYDGYRVEGLPQVRWEATLTRKFDSSARLLREELAVTSFQKTYMAKPQGKVSDEVRRVYHNLKTRRPLDIRATGDVCGAAAAHLDEAIDLRPLFVISPAVAVRLSPGDAHVAVDYAYAD